MSRGPRPTGLVYIVASGSCCSPSPSLLFLLLLLLHRLAPHSASRLSLSWRFVHGSQHHDLCLTLFPPPLLFTTLVEVGHQGRYSRVCRLFNDHSPSAEKKPTRALTRLSFLCFSPGLYCGLSSLRLASSRALGSLWESTERGDARGLRAGGSRPCILDEMLFRMHAEMNRKRGLHLVISR